MERKFLLCEICGNLIDKTSNIESTPVCCGNVMKELVPNMTEAAGEKHIPVIEIKDNIATVTVGEVLHPMLEEHFIKWIYLETNKGIKKVNLKPDMEPIAKFDLLDGEEVIGAYAYCNLHSLWRTNN